MSRKSVLVVVFLVASVVAFPLAGDVGHGSLKLTNWQAPSSWTPRGVLTDQSGPMPFVPIAPCRVADTRVGFGFTGVYGPPAISGGSSRTLSISGSGCTGIPSSAAAFSFNFTVTNTTGGGFVQAYPAGGSAGGSSVVNYTAAGQTIANAAITPSGTGGNAGKITVTVGVSTTDLIIDVNGYYAGAPSSGLGMSLTSTSSDTLTLNHTGGWNALTVNANTASYGIWGTNSSTTCSSTCGLAFSIASTMDNAYSITGSTSGSLTRNVGVQGISAGKGSGYLPATAASGVLGTASNTGSAYANGVSGKTASTSSLAAGVLGEATASAANGGGFFNSSGVGVNTWLAFFSGSTPMGVATNGQIYGTNGLQISGTKNFVAPHPEDPSKEIAYVAAEGPTSDVFFRGTATLRNGSALIPVPDHFRLVAREGSYMTTVTPVGRNAGLYVESEGPEGIVVRGSGDARFHYVVWGERDEFRDQEPIRANTHFTPESMEKVGALKTFAESTKALLVRNGTLNPDETYNLATARRLGWNVPEPRPAYVPAPFVPEEEKKR